MAWILDFIELDLGSDYYFQFTSSLKALLLILNLVLSDSGACQGCY